MATQATLSAGPHTADDPRDLSAVYYQGIIAGALGASTIAFWFFVVDWLSGHPFRTPAILGTALFRHSAGLESPETFIPSFEMVIAFTWVHFLVFCIIGGFVSRLLAFAEQTRNVGFGLMILFVLLEGGFVFGGSAFAESALKVIAWPLVLIGNLLAAGVMTAYFWRHHPHLVIEP